MTDPVQVFVTPAPSIVITIDPIGAATAATTRALLEAATPTAVALITGTAVTVWSGLVDTYGSRGGELVLTKTDGSRIRRRLHINTDSVVAGADATAATIAASGLGTHADIASTAIDADVSGAGTAQVARLRITATANGASWLAVFYPDFLKSA